MKFVAFLRGVNVRGTTMKMSEVCHVFRNAGMKNVLFVLATGNIVFESEKSSAELKNVLEKALSEHFNYEAFLFIRTEQEVSAIYKNNPFTKSNDLHIYAFVTTESTEELLYETFLRCEKSLNEKAEIVQNTFYWQVEKGSTLNSEFGKILGKKSFKDKITSRNINTFEKVINKI